MAIQPKPDLVAASCLATFQGIRAINTVSWSPDGTRLALGDDAFGVEVITAEGRSLWRRTEDSNRIWSVRWSPEGRHLASASADGTIRIWEGQSGGTRVLSTGGHACMGVAWSPTSDRLAWTSDSEILVASVPTGRLLFSCPGHSRSTTDVAWSPDGSLLASCSYDNAVRLWEGSTGRFLNSFSHANFVRSLGWSPNSRLLASCGYDETVRIWDTADGACLLDLKIGDRDLESIQWSPAAELIAVGSDSGSVHLLNPQDGHILGELNSHSSIVWSVAFSPDGTRLASASEDKALRIWDIAALAARQDRSPRASSDFLYIARQAATVGRRVARRPQSAWVPHLPGASGDCLGVLGRDALSVDVFNDGLSMATGHSHGKVRHWDLRKGIPIWTGEAGGLSVVDVRVAQDGSKIASLSPRLGGVVQVWSAETGELLWSHSASGWQIAWSHDSRRLAASSSSYFSHGLHVFEAENGHRDGRGFEVRQEPRCVDWSPDGHRLATAHADFFKIWITDSRSCLHTLQSPETSLRNAIKDLKWSPDGRGLAVGYLSADVELWDSQTWELRLQYRGHKRVANGVESLAWSPDAELIASTGADGQIRIWQAATGRDVVQFSHGGRPARYLAWAPSGAFLVSAHGRDGFRLWDTRKLLRVSMEVVVDSTYTGALPHELLSLPGALASLHRIGLHPPLSLVKDLLALTGEAKGQGTVEALSRHPGIRALANLRWPTQARVGLVAMLLRSVPLEGWEPPPGMGPSEVAAALSRVLRSEAGEPEAPPPPVAALQNAAGDIDERLLTLLEVLGPEAVAADPGLPLQLVPRLPSLPPLTAAQRRLLGLRLHHGSSGRSMGHGPGSERSGVELRGDLRSLLTSQLALPAQVLASRYLRGELLYRARTGEESPRLRPAVLVLDVSPASFGPIEATTRLGAHLVASSLLAAGLPVVLIQAGGTPAAHLIERPADLAELWITRSLEPAEAVRTLSLARTMRETLRDGPLEPIVLLLAHAWFGAEEEAAVIPGLRGLFVQFPGHQARPALASICERWESLPAGKTEGLAEILGRLAR